MKFRIPVCICLLLLILSTEINAQAPAWLWGKKGGGAMSDYTTGVCVDRWDNTTICGYYLSDSVKFGMFVLPNTKTFAKEIFVARYNAAGTLLWARSWGGRSVDQPTGIASDSAGNIFLTGTFSSDSISFGSTTLYNAGTNATTDIFVLKLDSAGDPVWAVKFGGSEIESASAIESDMLGHLYITGTFKGNSFACGTTNLISRDAVDEGDAFLFKLDTSGSFVWATSAGGELEEMTNSVATDVHGNVLMVGRFRSPVMICAGDSLKNANFASLFICKYDSAGNQQWARTIKASYLSSALDIATDLDGNAYISGLIATDSIMFGTSVLYNSINPNYDYLLLKFSSNGTPEWGHCGKSPFMSSNNSLTVLADGGLATTGFYWDSLTLGNLTTHSAGWEDMFVARYNKNGKILWVTSAGGTYGEVPAGIQAGPSGSLTVAGIFSSNTCYFGSIALPKIGFNDNTVDVFCARLQRKLIVSATMHVLESENVDSSLLVYTDYGWKASSGAEWLTLRDSVGSGDATLRYSVADNDSIWQRSAVIKVTSNGDTQNVVIVQDSSNIHASLREYSEESFHLYPNPTPGSFTITSADPVLAVSVCNILGEKILEKQTEVYLDLTEQPEGLYFVTIRTWEGSSTLKLFVHR